MADKPQQSSAEQYLAKVTAKNAQEAQQRRIDFFNKEKASGHVVPDLNPADKVVARLQQHAAEMKLEAQYRLKPPSENQDLRDRVARLEHLSCLILYSLNNTTVSASCSGTTTIITLTIPSLPAVC